MITASQHTEDGNHVEIHWRTEDADVWDLGLKFRYPKEWADRDGLVVAADESSFTVELIGDHGEMDCLLQVVSQ
jgi:hypothetical protein